MNILIIDTTALVLKVGILVDNKKFLVNLDNNQRHIENLIPKIKEGVLQRDKIIDNIDVILVNCGPGSFTGIRIGISTAIALGYSKKIEVYGFSSFDVYNFLLRDANSIIIPVIDAKKNRYYCSFIRNTLDELSILDISSYDIIDMIKKKYSADCVIFCGNDFSKIKSQIDKSDIKYEWQFSNGYNAEQLSSFSTLYLQKNNLKYPEPIYIRKSEAEIHLYEKLKIKETNV